MIRDANPPLERTKQGEYPLDPPCHPSFRIEPDRGGHHDPGCHPHFGLDQIVGNGPMIRGATSIHLVRDATLIWMEPDRGHSPMIRDATPPSLQNQARGKATLSRMLPLILDRTEQGG